MRSEGRSRAEAEAEPESGQAARAPGCVVGIDPGERWIGVARSAAGSNTALAIGTIDLAASGDGGRTELALMLRGLELGQLVVGLPVRADGGADEQARKFAELGGALAAHLGIPCLMQEERHTSGGAEMRERPGAGKARRPGARSKRRQRREAPQEHALAAARILQRWLDRHPA